MPTAVPSQYDDDVRTVSPEALLQQLRSDVRITLLDVRERPRIRASGTIAEARSFPLSEMDRRIQELDDCRSTPVVVVSQRGRRARTAARMLQTAGLGEVFVLEGGLDAWVELGYAVEDRESTPSWRP